MNILDIFQYIWNFFETYLSPVQVIRVYERGVRLTLGRNPVLIEPGLTWKVPLVQEISTVLVKPDTLPCGSVRVTTADNKTITVSPIIEYEITDPLKWLLDVNDAATNLRDLGRGITADYLTDSSWDDIIRKKTLTDIKKKLNAKVEDMGCKITSVMFADICQTRVLLTSL